MPLQASALASAGAFGLPVEPAMRQQRSFAAPASRSRCLSAKRLAWGEACRARQWHTTHNANLRIAHEAQVTGLVCACHGCMRICELCCFNRTDMSTLHRGERLSCKGSGAKGSPLNNQIFSHLATDVQGGAKIRKLNMAMLKSLHVTVNHKDKATITVNRSTTA